MVSFRRRAGLSQLIFGDCLRWFVVGTTKADLLGHDVACFSLNPKTQCGRDKKVKNVIFIIILEFNRARIVSLFLVFMLSYANHLPAPVSGIVI